MEIVRFFEAFILTFTEFRQKNETVKFLFFWHFSVTFNVSFTKIICVSMPHELNVFFLAFWHMKFNIFLHLKKYLYQVNCSAILPVCCKHLILQIVKFTDTKACLYDGDVNKNRTYEKKACRNTKK